MRQFRVVANLGDGDCLDVTLVGVCAILTHSRIRRRSRGRLCECGVWQFSRWALVEWLGNVCLASLELESGHGK